MTRWRLERTVIVDIVYHIDAETPEEALEKMETTEPTSRTAIDTIGDIDIYNDRTNLLAQAFDQSEIEAQA